MAIKQVELAGVGAVRLYKRRGVRSLRISVVSNGVVRVSMPSWMPYKTALAFVKAKESWIADQQQKSAPLLFSGQAIGKAHHLYFVSESTISVVKTRVKTSQVIIYHPPTISSKQPSVQTAAKGAIKRALKIEADHLLPQRLAQLAATNQYEYRKLSTRTLKSRWGSCSQKKDISLNIYLMQLPWQLIDYVLLHELVHTRIMSHGPAFWAEFESHLPNAKKLRKEIKTYHPDIFIPEFASEI